MKIDSNDQIMKSLYPEETVKHRKAGDKEFGNILKETLAEKPRPDAAPRQSAFVNPLASVRLTPEDSPDPRLAIDRIENMIDLLDRYRHQLADPRQNLKQMDTTIGDIVRENENLASFADTLADDEIKGILNQTMITASLEVAKFYRGDYIPV